MNGIFSLDGPMMRVLGKVADCLVLSVMWLLGSIPLITIGASTAALYTMTLRIIRAEEGKLIPGFWKAYWENFRQGTVIHLILTLLVLMIYIHSRSVQAMEGQIRMVFWAGTCLFGIIWLMETLFVYPVLARFSNSTGNIMKNAFLMASGNVPVFFGVVLITGLPLWTLLLNTQLFISMVPAWIFIGPGLIALLNSFLFHQCFRKYIPEEESGETGTEEEA